MQEFDYRSSLDLERGRTAHTLYGETDRLLGNLALEYTRREVTPEVYLNQIRIAFSARNIWWEITQGEHKYAARLREVADGEKTSRFLIDPHDEVICEFPSTDQLTDPKNIRALKDLGYIAERVLRERGFIPSSLVVSASKEFRL